MPNKITSSLEDYLEAIYKILEEKKQVKAVEIARMLGVGRSSVTDALKTLNSKGLVNYERYQPISLTDKGIEAAKKVALKHNVLFEFLSRILDVEIEMAQQNACRIEHDISDEVLEKIICFIEFNRKVHNDYTCYIEQFREYCKNRDIMEIIQ